MTKLAEREGNGFSRRAVFETGGMMLCGGENSLANLDLSYYFTGTISGQHEDERSVARLVKRLVREGDIFFDLGANFGFYSFFVAPLCGRSGEIHAFEANPSLISHLRRSIELNREYACIYLNAFAVGKESGGYLPLYGPERIGCSSLYPHEWLNRDSKVLVPIISIDQYVREKGIRRIDVMKIDIEGAELDALLGMKETFRLCPPKVIICELTLLPERDDPLRGGSEVTRRAAAAADPQELADFLKQRGYELWNIGDDGRLRTWEGSELTAASLKLTNVAFVSQELHRLRPEVFARPPQEAALEQPQTLVQPGVMARTGR
jgi:FkbM family methyltransferase